METPREDEKEELISSPCSNPKNTEQEINIPSNIIVEEVLLDLMRKPLSVNINLLE